MVDGGAGQVPHLSSGAGQAAAARGATGKQGCRCQRIWYCRRERAAVGDGALAPVQHGVGLHVGGWHRPDKGGCALALLNIGVGCSGYRGMVLEAAAEDGVVELLPLCHLSALASGGQAKGAGGTKQRKQLQGWRMQFIFITAWPGGFGTLAMARQGC